MSTAAQFNPQVPFNDLPPLPPAQIVETAAVLKKVIDARTQLAQLDTACTLIPNPQIITSTIPLREAQASSEIENIVTTNDELFRAASAVDVTPSAATKEALRYSEALYTGVSSLAERPLSVKTATQVCSVLQGRAAQIRSMPGTYIGDPAAGTHIYTPPEGKDIIENHLARWERFLYSDHGLDPLVLMALSHYQFEAIHPFYDGNGRTGRILNVLLLIQEGLLTYPVLYLSGYIVDNKTEYYRLLRGVTEHGEWEPWILFLLHGVATSAQSTHAMIMALRALEEETAQKIRALGTVGPAAEVAELTIAKPYVRISELVEAGLAQRETASKWLTHLARAGVLQEEKVGRTKVFVNDAALEILAAQ